MEGEASIDERLHDLEVAVNDIVVKMDNLTRLMQAWRGAQIEMLAGGEDFLGIPFDTSALAKRRQRASR